MKKDVIKVLPLLLIIPTLYYAALGLIILLIPVVILIILGIVNEKNNILFNFSSAYTLAGMLVWTSHVLIPNSKSGDLDTIEIISAVYMTGLSIFIWISGFFNNSFFKTIFFGYLVEKWRRLIRVSVVILILYLYYIDFYEQFYSKELLYNFLFYIVVFFISWLFEPFFKKN